MTTNIEQTYTRAADALAVTLTYPKPITDALKRRDAAAALAELTPRDAAAEITAAPNPRSWDGILTDIASHNARCTEARNAIRGGVLSRANTQVDHALTAWVPEYTDATHETVSGHLTALTHAAQTVHELDPQHAIAHGYGDALTELYAAASALDAHARVGDETTGTDATTRAARMLSLMVEPPAIDPIRRTAPTRWNPGEIVSTTDEIDQRNTARQLMTDWLKDRPATLHRLARHEYPGHHLSAATSETYPHRVEQYRNADRVNVVTAA